MNQIKISAKNLGYTALADFCPRCYWIKLKTSHKLPWQTFPGIFSSIDSYTKSCIHHIIDSSMERPSRQIKSGSDYYEYPEWMKELGEIATYKTVPHWSKNKYHDTKSDILLIGAPDDILTRADGSKVIPDWKTAKHTDTQDQLLPLYEVQLNVYAILNGDVNTDLFLVYMEPITDKSAASCNIIDVGFNMGFNAVVVPVVNDRKVVRQALATTREIFDMEKPPDSRVGCKDCQNLDKIIGILGMEKISNAGLEE